MTDRRLALLFVVCMCVCCDCRVLSKKRAASPVPTTPRPGPVTPSPAPATSSPGPATSSPRTATPSPGPVTAWPTTRFPTQPTPSIVTSIPTACNCSNFAYNVSRLLYTPAGSPEEYSGRFCRSSKAVVDCLLDPGSGCSWQFMTFDIQHKTLCDYEDRCRLIDTGSYCLSQYTSTFNPVLLESYAETCKNLATIDKCASDRMSTAGCTWGNRATLFWSFQRLSLDNSCYFLDVGLNDTCVARYDACVLRNFNEFMDGLRNLDFPKVCSYAKAAIECIQKQLAALPDDRCDRARQYFRSAITKLLEMTSVCNKCSKNDNVYTTVPNTNCTQYSQSTIHGGNTGVLTCPVGTTFDTKTCVCNWSNLVYCQN